MDETLDAVVPKFGLSHQQNKRAYEEESRKFKSSGTDGMNNFYQFA
jgi:hypothetical protein